MDAPEINETEGLWVAEDVASYLRVSVRTVGQWAKSGRLPVVKVGSLNRFRREDIDEWLRAEGGVATVDEGAA